MRFAGGKLAAADEGVPTRRGWENGGRETKGRAEEPRGREAAETVDSDGETAGGTGACDQHGGFIQRGGGRYWPLSSVRCRSSQILRGAASSEEECWRMRGMGWQDQMAGSVE